MAQEIEVVHFVVGHSRGQTKKVANDLEPLQELVGGLLEPVNMRFGLLLLCNEEGLIRKLPVGYAVATLLGIIPVRGDFFICRRAGGEFTSVHTRDYRIIQSEVVPV